MNVLDTTEIMNHIYFIFDCSMNNITSHNSKYVLIKYKVILKV